MEDKKKKTSSGKEDIDVEKITSLQKMIAEAERTITTAKQMLAQVQGSKKVAERESITTGLSNGKVIFGSFDGQIMIGEDGKQYPVPANYASKSKLVEGDTLKLTITPEGNFVYKQVGPIERKYMFGIVELDEKANHTVFAEGKKYKVLMAAATYFKIEPGDEVTLIVPRDKACVWGAIENVLRKADDIVRDTVPAQTDFGKYHQEDIERSKEEARNDEEEDDEFLSDKPSAIERLEKEIQEERKRKNGGYIMDEWTPDLEDLKKEASYPAGVSSVDNENE